MSAARRGLRLLALLAPLALPPAAPAQEAAGTAAAVVLQLAPAPRPLALGGAYAALAADELSLFYNPARLAPAPTAIGLAYQTLPAGAGAGALAGVRPLGPGTLAAGLQFLSYGEIDVVEPDPEWNGERGRPTGERAGAGEVALTTGYGLAVGPLQLGAALKWLHLQYAGAGGTGAALDLGAAADLLGGRLTLAAAAQNLGGEAGPGREAPLPRRFRVGGALRADGPGGSRGALAVEAIARAGGGVALVAGFEAGVAGPGGAALVARAGWRAAEAPGDARAPLVFGGGIALDAVAVDYAYRALGPLGTTHLFGITVHPGRQ